MVANKMTGEKGVLFTAAYVTKFDELEKQQNKPMTIEDMIIAQANSVKELRNEVSHQSFELQKMRLVVDNEVWLTEHQKQLLQTAVNKRVKVLEEEGYEAHYQAIWGALKRHFGVSKYDKIPRKYHETAIRFVNGWYPAFKTNLL